MSNSPHATAAMKVGAGAPPAASNAMPDRDTHKTGESFAARVLSPLASIRLTVVLLACSIFLTYAGTLAQARSGLFTVLDRYFRTFIALIEVDALTFHIFDLPKWLVIPFPGGWLLGTLLLANLIAAHSVRFKMKQTGPAVAYGTILLAVCIAAFAAMFAKVHFKVPALQSYNAEMLLLTVISVVAFAACRLLFVKRAGIVMLHGGLIFLLLSEVITGLFAVEATMTINEGQTVNYVEVARAWELAVIDTSDPSEDRVAVVPGSRLRQSARHGEAIADPALPFTVTVRRWMTNSDIKPPAGVEPTRVTRGDLLRGDLVEVDEFSGVGDQASMVDLPGAVLALQSADGRSLGEVTVAGLLSRLDLPRTVTVDAKPYDLYLRFKRVYKPYAIHLHDFIHDVYPGTDVPKDYRAIVQLTDESHDVDRRVEIYMNNPLRYQGETFYQASFLPGDTGTILQVVQNPGRLVPYVSCFLVAVGLLGHFLYRLADFLRRTAKP